MQLHAIAAIKLTSAGLIVLAGISPAQGENDRFSTGLTLEFQTDITISADDLDEEITNLSGEAATTSVLRLSPDLSLDVGLVFESLNNPSGRRDQFFDAHGLIVEQAYLSYSPPGFDVFAGKFNPRFGRAWGEMPGIYGDDFAKDYEFVEALGAGIRIHLGKGSPGGLQLPGEQEIGLSVYRSDTTVASGSLLYSRGRTELADGGPANTPGLSSVALTWRGSQFPGPELEYNLGASYRAGGRGDPRDEVGLVAGVLGSRALSGDVEVTGLAEVAHFWNADAQRQDRLNTSLGATFSFDGDWRLVLAYARRDSSPEIGSASTDHLFEVSGGYRFENGVGLDIGYLASRESGGWARGVGLLASYSTEF